MKLATYNVNGINGRLPVLLRWLKEAKPDVVCLQELKAPFDRFPLKAINDAGYKAIWHGQKSWNGVAILSRGELQEVRRALPGDAEDMHSRYIEAVVNKMIIACIYLPNGNPYPGPKFDYKLKWLKRLQAHAKKLLAHKIPVALIGDFNVIPTELDVYKPEKYENKDALFSKEARAGFKKLVEQGWTDAIRKLHPKETIYTFWDYFRKAYERNAGMRIDHFLLDPQLAKRLKKTGVDKQVRGWPKTSDHAPVWIELKDK
ncbi:MAG TPA: exodeoxyribonuclease III [Chitinophagaceae bacterium]|jgi:exodeoxyribonuclease-3|nr:exodeoxyribonuclease III [Chitinophagaceae bacterium]